MENRNVYVGHRYVPKIMGEHDSTQTYEGLSIVTKEGASFTSKKHVPIGVEITNEEFWVNTGNYNVQIEQYRQDVRNLEKNTSDSIERVESDYKNDISEFKELMNSEINTLNNDINKKSEVAKQTLQVKIPTDYPTLQNAINDLSEKTFPQGIEVELLIESGHIITDGISVKNGTYSNFIISSVDNVVKANVERHLIYGMSCNMPTLNCLFDMEGLGGTGYYAENSRGKVNAKCGVMNPGESGISANSVSTVMAQSTIFTGASAKAPQYTGITARRGSSINADYADVSGSHYYGISAASGAFVSAVGANADSCQVYGFRSRDGAMMSCAESTAKNCGDTGYYALWSGVMDARKADGSGCERGFYAAEGGNINARGSRANNCKKYGIYAFHNSLVNANACEIQNTMGTGVRSDSGSNVNLRKAMVISSNVNDLEVASGSFITVTEANFNTKNVENLNTITENRGIIWG